MTWLRNDGTESLNLAETQRVWARLALALAVFLTGSGTAPAQEPPRSPVEILVDKQHGQTSLHIEWQALVHESGGHFLLYRGRDPQAIELVAKVVASGSGSYEFIDAQALPDSSVYQLKYLDREGREHVLTTVRVSISQLMTLPAAATIQRDQGPSPVMSPDRWRWSAFPVARRHGTAGVPLPGGEAPEPLLPPPRRG